MSNLQTQQLLARITPQTVTVTQEHGQQVPCKQVGVGQHVAGSQQGGDQRTQPPITASSSNTTQPPQQPVNVAPDMRIPVKSWTPKHYRQLGDWICARLSGERIMQHCGIKRRKDLQALVQVASQQRKEYLEIQWNLECIPGEGQRALPQLTVGDDGSFRISKTRLTRLGITFPEGAKLHVQKGQDGCLIIKMQGTAAK